MVRVLPVGVTVCRKGEPVEHWIGIIDGLVKMTSVIRSSYLTLSRRKLTLRSATIASGPWQCAQVALAR